jgi:hypothetical protein
MVGRCPLGLSGGLKTYRVKSAAKKKPTKAKAASVRFVRQEGPLVEMGGHCIATVIMVGGEEISGWCLVAAIE